MDIANYTESDWSDYIANNPDGEAVAARYPNGAAALAKIRQAKSDLNQHVQRLLAEIVANVYNPTIFRQHLAQNQNDAHLTISKLLTPPVAVQYGFTELARHGRLDLSMEALVLFPSEHAKKDFSFLFSGLVKDEARRRLRGGGVNAAW